MADYKSFLQTLRDTPVGVSNIHILLGKLRDDIAAAMHGITLPHAYYDRIANAFAQAHAHAEDIHDAMQDEPAARPSEEQERAVQDAAEPKSMRPQQQVDMLKAAKKPFTFDEEKEPDEPDDTGDEDYDDRPRGASLRGR